MKAGCLAVVLAFSVGVSATQQPAPQMSELEQARIETLALKRQLVEAIRQAGICQGRLAVAEYQQNTQVLESEAKQMQTQIETAHPGYTFQLTTGVLTKKPELTETVK